MSRRVLLVLTLAACGGDATVAVDAGPCLDPVHDEDGDRIGDRCDVCPTVSDPRQLDTTETATFQFPDGVGDACDPRPGRGGDKLAAFHPFADPATAAAWNGAGWTIANDRAHATDAARWINRSLEQGDGVFVQARISSLAWIDGGRVDVVVDGDGIESGISCAIVRDRDGDGNDEVEAREIGGALMTQSLGKAIAGPIVLTGWRVIDVQRRGTFTCRVKLDDGTTELEFATVDDLAIGIYGMAAASATTDVDSLAVYTSPTLPEQMP